MPLSGTSSSGANVRLERSSPPPLPIIGIKRASFSSCQLGSMKVKMRRACAVLAHGREPLLSAKSVNVFCCCFVERTYDCGGVISLSRFNGVIGSQTESYGWVEIIRLTRRAERTLEAGGRQRPGIATDRVLPVNGIGVLGIRVVGALRPLSNSAS